VVSFTPQSLYPPGKSPWYPLEVKARYQVKMSNGFAALENLDDDNVDISKGLESIKRK
jgi:hypothetical protein